MIEHVKCNCTKYSIPENDYYEPPIRVSTKKNDILIAVMSNRKNVVLHKIVKAELIYSDTIYTGIQSRNKIVGLEWSRQNELLIVTIDMKCVIYKKKKESEKWICTNVNIPTEELPTCVCWHPYAYSFAIGFSTGNIFICSKKEKEKWTIKQIVSHAGSILFLEWGSSGYILSTTSMDSTARIVCTLGLSDERSKHEEQYGAYGNIEDLIAQRDLKNNDIICKIECEGYVICHSSFSLSNEKVAIIANNFENSYEKQQIIIADYCKSPANIQFVSWVGQTFQKSLFFGEDKLLVYGYEIFPIIIDCVNGEWVISKVVLPEFTIKNLSFDFFYDKKNIQDIEKECNHINGNEVTGEIIPHSNSILQISMLEPYESKEYTQFITASSDFNIVLWTFIF
ncbi:actin-related protein 2/3 complex subunit 1 [Plasmodium brasilianum]|uniref:Actin-related protein 2/3 complex subunit 1, putative n=2 Tax=Plasmodium (Plasmodium) TaxID=418103 RepID=A0A1D3PCD1_PLAMA|nr:actin-related protein 2/3 complex subunit 1, putative [Plasmodium malariae]KAI4838315.1 actin-related protein 2/3 complex subunit 1 [Plasmodium brasilianum]SCN12708.1 actin-related protein 2/3 complex subunit 1, putative [Plasmodium malariae]